MTPAQPLKLLKRETGSEFRIELRNELFLSTYHRDGGLAVGLWLPAAVVGTPKALELFKLAALAVGFPPASVTLKIIGPRDLVVKAENHFKESGVTRIEARPRDGGQELLFYPENGRLRAAPLKENATKAPAGKTKVLIVDDSKTIRSLLEKILGADPQLEIVGSVERPSLVEPAIQKNKPDVITLDIHMPEMDGVKLLKRLLPRHPIPTVMISSISMEEGPMVLSALEAGAVDYIQKPSFDQISVVAPMIVEKVKNAALAKVHVPSRASSISGAPKVRKSAIELTCDTRQSTIVAIGSSTGGTEALRQVLTQLPSEIPPVVIVQHIPPVFSKAFANRMNELCPFEVKEAENGDAVVPNRVLIAPGGTQMKMVKHGNGYQVAIDPSAEPVNRHKPSVDVLFDSVAQLIGNRAIGVILTGMGADGAKGLLKMLNAGARTLGQDEATCVVYGMPQAAFKLGAVQEQLPLTSIADGIVRLWKNGKKAA